MALHGHFTERRRRRFIAMQTKEARRSLDSQPDFSVTSSRLRSKEETDVWRFGFFPFVLIDRVEVCMAEKGYRYGVFFAARNESELEGRAFLCGQKRQRTRDPPLGSCTCRAREPVPIPVQNGARVSCKWRIRKCCIGLYFPEFLSFQLPQEKVKKKSKSWKTWAFLKSRRKGLHDM